MIAFFRRIRKSLLAEGNFSKPASPFGKYLVYAIGEILLVMIGILLALQVNNWNENRNERKVEQEILKEISTNIGLNIDFIIQNIRFNKNGTHAFEILRQAYEKKKPWVDSLSRYVGGALVVRPPTLSFSSFESLKNLGFGIISSNSFRKEIVDLFELNYNNLTTIETRIINIELKPAIADFTTLNFEHELTSSNAKLLQPNNPTSILKNQKLKNLLTNIQWYRNRKFFDLETQSLEENQRVLQLIKEELDEVEIHK